MTIEKQKRILLERLREHLFKNQDRLKPVSNDAIELAAVIRDKELVALSLAAYALYKLSSKHHIVSTKEWPKFLRDIAADLDECIKEKKRVAEILDKDIIMAIERIDERYGNYVRSVIDNARIKQASRAYAIGLSLATAAELTGARQADVAEYIGGTTIHDDFESKKGVIERFKDIKRVLQ